MKRSYTEPHIEQIALTSDRDIMVLSWVDELSADDWDGVSIQGREWVDANS